MTGTRRGKSKIPQRQTLAGSGYANTSATSDSPRYMSAGTTNIELGSDVKYTDLPPPPTRHAEKHSTDWTIEKIGSYLGVGTTILALIFFFYRMDSNIESMKNELKDVKDKIEKIDEKSNKQTSAIENETNATQRLENEIRRTQDYVREKGK